MFARRTRLPFWSRLRSLVWPRGGFARASKYLLARLGRMRGTPHSIAAGFAAGAAVSFTPLMGFHFLLGFAIAFVTRGSLLAAAFGTAVGNPWTFPFIWLGIYYVGCAVLGFDPTPSEVTGGVVGQMLSDLWALLSGAAPWRAVAPGLRDVFLPMGVGGVIMATLVWPLFYLPLYRAIRLAQTVRQTRLAKGRARRGGVLVKRTEA